MYGDLRGGLAAMRNSCNDTDNPANLFDVGFNKL